MNYKNYGKNLLLFICFNAMTICSAAQTATMKNSAWLSTLMHGHLVLELGAYQAIQGNTQHINIQDLIGDTFTVPNRYDTSALLLNNLNTGNIYANAIQCSVSN